MTKLTRRSLIGTVASTAAVTALPPVVREVAALAPTTATFTLPGRSPEPFVIRNAGSAAVTVKAWGGPSITLDPSEVKALDWVDDEFVVEMRA